MEYIFHLNKHRISTFSSRSFIRYASTTTASSTSSSTPSATLNISKIANKRNAMNKVESLRGNNQLISLLKYNSNNNNQSSQQYQSHQKIAEPLPPTASKGWTPTSVRTGIIGIKAGMTTDWDSWGVRKTLTVIKVGINDYFI